LAFGVISEASSEQAWQQVELAYRYNPELLESQHKNFYPSYCHNINSLALKAWSRKASTAEHMPNFLQQIQIQQNRVVGQEVVESMNTSIPQIANLVPEGLTSNHQLFNFNLDTSENGGQTWEYWLNTFDNAELLGI